MVPWWTVPLAVVFGPPVLVVVAGVIMRITGVAAKLAAGKTRTYSRGG